jgi:hypothetical protein
MTQARLVCLTLILYMQLCHWRYPGKVGCCLQPEIDGLRIITNRTSEFMHRVTSQSLAVLRIGSMEVGALLNDAFKEYEVGKCTTVAVLCTWVWVGIPSCRIIILYMYTLWLSVLSMHQSIEWNSNSVNSFKRTLSFCFVQLGQVARCRTDAQRYWLLKKVKWNKLKI